MKYRNITCAFFAILGSQDPLFANPDNERELKQLTEQRATDMAAAARPINRRYQSALEQLLRTATQSGDLDTAVKVRDALKIIGATELTNRKKDLKRLLTAGPWLWSGKGDFSDPPDNSVTFKEDGKCSIAKGSLQSWEILPSGQLKVTMRPGANWVFDMDLETKEGRSNLEASSIKDKKAIRLVERKE